MTTRRRTTVAERNDFTNRHAAGESYEEIAEDTGWSQWTVRYCCRQARDGGRIALDPPDGRKARGGPMSTFSGGVRYWWRAVSKVGQISLGSQRYGVGIQYARQDVRITFEPETAEFIAWDSHGAEIKRLTPQGLTMAEITGLDVPPEECD